MKGIYFASFYFRVWDLTREIRENKNPAKISTYTVLVKPLHCMYFILIWYWSDRKMGDIAFYFPNYKVPDRGSIQLYRLHVKMKKNWDVFSYYLKF